MLEQSLGSEVEVSAGSPNTNILESEGSILPSTLLLSIFSTLPKTINSFDGATIMLQRCEKVTFPQNLVFEHSAAH